MSIDLDVLEGLRDQADPQLVTGPSVPVVAQLLRDGFAAQHPKPKVPANPDADAAFIVAAVNALPDLIAAARERDGLREAIETIAAIAALEDATDNVSRDDFSRGVRAVLRALIKCNECGCESRSFSMVVCGEAAAVSEAIAAWNTRAAPSPAAPEGVEELKRQVEILRRAVAVPVPDDDSDFTPEKARRGGESWRTMASNLIAAWDALPQETEGWREIAEYSGCGPVLVSTAPYSPKYLASDPVTAFKDVTGVWRCLGSIGGCEPLALQPTHFAPMPKRPTLPPLADGGR